MIKVEKFEVSRILKMNCYILFDDETGDTAIVDPGFKSNELDEEINKIGADNFKYILITHGHFDHISAVPYYKEMLSNAKIVINKNEAEFTINKNLNLGQGKFEVKGFKPDILLNDGDIINFGNTEIKLISTPGHTIGSSCYMLNDIMFTGDTLMKNTIGRMDLPTSDENSMKESLRKFKSFNKDFKIYPGHGQATTLEHEKNYNSYFNI